MVIWGSLDGDKFSIIWRFYLLALYLCKCEKLWIQERMQDCGAKTMGTNLGRRQHCTPATHPGLAPPQRQPLRQLRPAQPHIGQRRLRPARLSWTSTNRTSVIRRTMPSPSSEEKCLCSEERYSLFFTCNWMWRLFNVYYSTVCILICLDIY